MLIAKQGAARAAVKFRVGKGRPGLWELIGASTIAGGNWVSLPLRSSPAEATRRQKINGQGTACYMAVDLPGDMDETKEVKKRERDK
jgi:hypothetical protein